MEISPMLLDVRELYKFSNNITRWNIEEIGYVLTLF